MRVLCATSWKVACGIADYAEQAIAGIRAADRGIVIEPYVEALDPAWAWAHRADYDWLWLNHHDGLHSRWTPEEVRRWVDAGVLVLVTYHDTFSGEDRPNSDKAKALLEIAHAFVVHEPVTDLLGAVLIRQGVHAGSRAKLTDRAKLVEGGFLSYPHQPILASVGFNFPWKNFDQLAEVSARCGWALLLLSNDATHEDEQRWRGLNPNLLCIRQFLPQHEAIGWLTSADATIFAYTCANAGTSGAIRQGIAARKPVIAWEGCRQFRDLRVAVGNGLIHWCPDFETLPDVLSRIPIQPVDPGIAFLAARDAWPVAGAAYVRLLRGVP